MSKYRAFVDSHPLHNPLDIGLMVLFVCGTVIGILLAGGGA
ncbi:hypothetical protein [Pelagibacterium halotolerans]|uniref:Uncharacterized protein n=1 Tax=Pelagibacterium halotolerans (strain DSM 22347 / JCM 15775 / CGMCC 1.7692 / B2) TaxID=1082931 RepID=G4RDZ3_PELHB|nr:hypothetical protein [Pelagibacterium halotolerans]AEQ50787.1 hypothetical protein KKY_748 [Pelagibacterium halotolerans B2]